MIARALELSFRFRGVQSDEMSYQEGRDATANELRRVGKLDVACGKVSKDSVNNALGIRVGKRILTDILCPGQVLRLLVQRLNRYRGRDGRSFREFWFIHIQEIEDLLVLDLARHERLIQVHHLDRGWRVPRIENVEVSVSEEMSHRTI